MANRKVVLAVWCLWIVAAGAAAVAQQLDGGPEKGKQKSQFLRLVRDAGRTPVALQAAIVRCAPRDRGRPGLTVDLVSAVHVADKSYYRMLNGEFRNYDAVLYELVAPEGTKVPKGGRAGGSPVSMLQRGMKDILELEFQLEQIDYTQKNMIHADMSPEQFAQSMLRRGESMFSMFLRMLGYALARQSQQPGGATDTQLLLALFDKNRALALKRLMAEQFQDMEGTLIALEGPEGSTLISERNKVALKVLRKEISAGKRKIAIFYGAGHMPDFQKRLGEEFGLSPRRTRWVVAWDLKAESKATPKPSPPQKSAHGDRDLSPPQ